MRARLTGFTLIEVMIVIGLFALLMGLGLALGMDVYRGVLHRGERQIIVDTLATARARAMTNLYESEHGVCAAGADLVIFRGASYSASSPTNESVPGNHATTLASTEFGCADGGIVFDQLSGRTDGGSITIHEDGRDDSTVEVNEEGAIIW